MRILGLTHPGTNSRDIFLDILAGYREAGNEVLLLELGPLWAFNQRHPDLRAAGVQLFAETMQGLAKTNHIDFAVCLWANGPLCLGCWDNRSFFEAAGLPVVMHWLDAPQWAHGNTVLDTPTAMLNGPRSVHVINNAGTAREMEAILGFRNIMVVPNAASPTSFAPRPAATREFDIVFAVGADDSRPTPLMLEQLERDEPDIPAIRAEAAAALRPRLVDMATIEGLPPESAPQLVDTLLAKRLACRDAQVLDQLVEISRDRAELAPLVLGLLKAPKRFVQFSMGLRQIEHWERAFTFVYLSRHFRCAAFGMQEPFRAWPGAWKYLGNLPYLEQSAAYGRAHFGLNVMRWQDDLGLNLKPFEITLSGAALLQGYRAGVAEHFAEGEIAVFRSPQECRAQAGRLLADPPRLAALAAAGRARSLAGHCWKHRAAAITAALNGTRSAAGQVPTAPQP